MKQLAALSVLSLGAGLVAQRVTEFEPNDTVGVAQTIAVGQHVAANLLATEQDWYAFTLTDGGEVHLKTSGNFGVNQAVDTVVFLYDASGTVQLAWNDNQPGTQSDLGVNLTPGSYTAKVIGKLVTTAGDYGLDLIVLPPANVSFVEGAEPNHGPLTGGTPTPIAVGTSPTVVIGGLAATTDQDWFTFSLGRRGILQGMVLDDSSAPQCDKTVLTLFQETAPSVWTQLNTSTSSTSHRAVGFTSNALVAGNYAFQVSTNAAGGTPPLVYTGIGNYSFRCLLLDMADANLVLEAPEPNNTIITSAGILPGDYAFGSITGGGEVDWYMLVVTSPTTVGAYTENGPAPMAGARVRFTDENGLSVGTAGGGSTSHGRAFATLPVAGIYFVEVAGGLFATAGDYMLHVAGGPAVTVAASFRTEPPSTNACFGSNALRPALTATTGEVPQLGSTFVVRLQNALPNAVVAPFFGFSRSLSGTTPLPFDLTALGAPGCFLRVDPLNLLVGVADGSGVYYQDIRLPSFLGLRGLTIYMQAMLLDQPNNALGVSMSNDVKMVAGDIGF